MSSNESLADDQTNEAMKINPRIRYYFVSLYYRNES